DHGRGPTGEYLGQGPVRAARSPLIGADATLLDLVAEVATESEHAVARDARKQCSGELWCHQPSLGTAAEDEEEVHASHILDAPVLDGVEPDDLLAALLRRLRLRGPAARAVAPVP